MTTIEDCLKGIESQAKFISALQEEPISANAARVILRDVEKVEKALEIENNWMKGATETIGVVIACCTYNSNDAVSAGKVSVDVKRELSDAEINELGAREAEKRDKK